MSGIKALFLKVLVERDQIEYRKRRWHRPIFWEHLRSMHNLLGCKQLQM